MYDYICRLKKPTLNVYGTCAISWTVTRGTSNGKQSGCLSVILTGDSTSPQGKYQDELTDISRKQES